jgi:hypothetical protein
MEQNQLNIPKVNPTPKPTKIPSVVDISISIQTPIKLPDEKKESFLNNLSGQLKNKIRSTEVFSPSYRPMVKSIFIEALYSLIFSHHIPILMKHGSIMDETPLISFNSITEFFLSYFGKIIFFITIYFTLHYFFMPMVRKIDFP